MIESGIQADQRQEINKTIIIITETRTGSNYLCALMNETGKLGCPSEYFNPRMNFENAIIISDRYQIARNIGMTPNGVLAIKLFTNHWNLLEESVEFSELFPNRFWIWLRRHDLLAQAISHVIAIQTRAWTSLVSPDITPAYSKEAIKHKIKDISIKESCWRMFFARNGISPLTLWYEDLIIQPQDIILKIAAFVDVEVDPKDIKTNVYTHKQHTSLNDEWKEKFISEMADVNYLDRITTKSSCVNLLQNFLRALTGKHPAPD